MKTVGIIGGIGPESTVEYYTSSIAGYRHLRPDGGYPSIILNSLDVTKLIAWMDANQLSEVTDYPGRRAAKGGQSGSGLRNHCRQYPAHRFR